MSHPDAGRIRRWCVLVGALLMLSGCTGDPAPEPSARPTPSEVPTGPPPAIGATPDLPVDVVAHWYNDFGLATGTNGRRGARVWSDWRWNRPSNTGDGVDSYGYDPQREPLQGFYRGDDPQVLGWQVTWALQAGVSAVSLVQSHGFDDDRWADPDSPSHWLYQLFHHVPAFERMRYLLWLQPGGSASALYRQMDDIVEVYRQYPRPYTIRRDGRRYAAVFCWDAERLRGSLDDYRGAERTGAFLGALAGRMRGLGYDGVAVLARNAGEIHRDYLDLGLRERGVLVLATGYSDVYQQDSPPFGDGFAGYAERAVFPTAQREVPVVQTAHDSVAPHPSSQRLPGSTPELFGRALRRAVASVRTHDQVPLVLVNNMSEWAESGPGLIPNRADGLGYLDQVRALAP